MFVNSRLTEAEFFVGDNKFHLFDSKWHLQGGKIRGFSKEAATARPLEEGNSEEMPESVLLLFADPGRNSFNYKFQFFQKGNLTKNKSAFFAELVKIAALSPEFPIGEETEKPEQSPPGVEPRFLTSSATSASRSDRWTLFDRGPGQTSFNQLKDVAKTRKTKESQTSDACGHKLELPESLLKWRDIRKTLHWLERILASNHTTMESCRRADLKRRSSLKGKKFSKKKKSTNSELNLEKILLNDSKASIHPKRNKKLKKERNHKHKSWKNRSREERNREEKLKSKQKESRFDKNYFQKKDLMKFSPNRPLTLNTTILKPDSVLYDVEKIFFKRTKSKGKNFNTECGDSIVKIMKYCGKRRTQKGNQEKEFKNLTEIWSPDPKLEEHQSNKKSPKQKPWPHFVYHRVSSNLLHPETTRNHKQSAYIAISVVSSSKPDSTENKV